MPPSIHTSAGTEGRILLVEEYDALGAAITAALRKFAPGHVVRVVRNLAAAREVAFETAPDLLIIDFDPPLAGALELLTELRRASPAMRVIIIAAGMPREIDREGRRPAALTFVEKPFQLEELGAAIQALLPSAGATSGHQSCTTLHELNLVDIIPLLGLEGVTEILNVTVAEQALSGEIHFARGQIQHAAASGLQGIDALREMLRWTSPDFARAESNLAAPRSIEGQWPTVLNKVLRSIPRSQLVTAGGGSALREASLPEKPAPPPPIIKDGKKILVIDDTETLRDFVQEMLTVADPHLQITCATDGTEGVRAALLFRPDLILLDYSLPDFNGDEVCRRLLEEKATSEIPIIMMSGHVAEMAETATRYENIVLTLSKPFVSAALVAAVAQTLAKPVESKPRRKDPTPLQAEHKVNGHQPAAMPTIAKPPSPPVPVTEPAPVIPEPPPPPAPPLDPEPFSTPVPAPVLTPALTSAHIPTATSDSVVLSIALEVVSMKFSPALRITSIRARPASATVILHVDPRAVSAVRLPAAAFEIALVDLDAHGSMENVRIVPAQRRPDALPPHTGVQVERLAVLPADAHSGIQITPASNAHMTIQLLAAFDLAGVELSPAFGVSSFVLRARGGRVRVILPGHGGKVGITFASARVTLDPFSRIAEMALDLVVS
ncbi:MAG: response regulator [Chthoniobacterales bacterium]